MKIIGRMSPYSYPFLGLIKSSNHTYTIDDHLPNSGTLKSTTLAPPKKYTPYTLRRSQGSHKTSKLFLSLSLAKSLAPKSTSHELQCFVYNKGVDDPSTPLCDLWTTLMTLQLISNDSLHYIMTLHIPVLRLGILLKK